MRKVYTNKTGIFFTLLFTACGQFHANIEEYLEYWSAEVSATGNAIDKPFQTIK